MCSFFVYLIMNTETLLQLHKTTCAKCYAVMQKKNNDYSGGLTSDDALANFKMSSTLGMPPVMGLLLRIQDKMMRIKTFATDGSLNVADESVYDAFEDIINYAILGKALMIENREDSTNKQTTPSNKHSEATIAGAANPKVRAVPNNIIAKAIDIFASGFIYFGEVHYFCEALSKITLFITEEEVNKSIEICEIPSDKGDDYILVAVKKDSQLYIALGGDGQTMSV